MAKFCTKCGKPLKDGICTSCEQQEVHSQATVSSNILNDGMKVIKGMMKKPKDTLEKYSDDEHWLLGLISIGIGILSFILCAYFLFRNVVVKSGVNFSLFASSSVSDSIGIVKFLLVKLLVSIILIMGLIIGIIYLFNNIIFKKNTSIKAIISMVGISSLFFSAGLLIAFLMSFISPLLACIIFILFAICFFVHLGIGIRTLSKMNDNQLIYTSASTLAIPFIAFIYIVYSFLILQVIMFSYSSVSSFTNIMGI